MNKEEKHFEYYVEYDTMYMHSRKSYKTYTEALNIVKYMLQRNEYQYIKFMNIQFYKLEKTMYRIDLYAEAIRKNKNYISLLEWCLTCANYNRNSDCCACFNSKQIETIDDETTIYESCDKYLASKI